MKDLFHGRYRRIIILFSFLIMTVVIGTVGFSVIENVSITTGFHMTIVTIFTVGFYGDMTIKTEAGRFFCDFIAVVGIGIGLYCLTQIMETVLSGRLREMFKMVDYESMIAKMKDHAIVCGFGQVGKAAVESLRQQGMGVVVLDKTELAMKELDASVARIIGDSTREEDLARAGIGHAKVVLVTFGKDADAILTTITIKYIKPSLMTIVRAENQENIDKMYKVGADAVVSPELEGGKSMSSAAFTSLGKGPTADAASPAKPG